MKKFIITEEERSRILGMHQSTAKRQYLNEDAVTVVPGTISVPYNIDPKTGAQVLATNQYVKVTIINEKTSQNKNGWLTEMGYDSLGQIQFQTPGLAFPLKGIQKDSNGNLTGMFAIVPTQKDLINYLTSMNGKNLPNTTSVFIELKGKGTVKSLPMGVTTKFTTYNPSTPTTTTPTKTKGLNESDIRRIVRRVIKESNRGYLMEDQSKINPVQQQVNLAVQEMNNLINNTTKTKQLTTPLPTIKIIKSQQAVPVKAADGTQTNVNIDSYGFELNGKPAKTGLDFSRTTDSGQYKNFILEWTKSLSDEAWLMNVGDRSLVYPLKNISDKYLASVNKLLSGVPATTTPTKQPVSKP
jgi:hypothetical protein